MKKKVTLMSLLFSLFLLSLPGVWAFDLNQIWLRILNIGNLSFLGMEGGPLVVGLTRILIGILVFAVFFAIITSTGGKGGPLSFLNRSQAGVVAAVLALISAIFLPAEVLLGVGAGWATAIAIILVGGPVVGLAYLLWKIPGKEEETKFTVILKILLCLLMLWILSAVKYHIAGLGGML